MIRHHTADNMWIEAANIMSEMAIEKPSREGPTMEVSGVSQSLETLACRNMVTCRPGKQPCPHYAGAEALWYLRAKPDVGWLTPYAPRYADRWAEPDGNAHGTNYGARAARFESMPTIDRLPSKDFNAVKRFRDKQLMLLVELIKAHPDTRRAVVQIWQPSDLIHSLLDSVKSVPCTTQLQFVRRGDVLDMHVYARSQDLWLGFPYDVYAMSVVQSMVASMLKLLPGAHHRYMASLHVYKADETKMFDQPAPKFGDANYNLYKSPQGETWDMVNVAIEIESMARYSATGAAEKIVSCRRDMGTALSDAVSAATHKWLLATEDGVEWAKTLEIDVVDVGLRQLLEAKRKAVSPC